MMLARALVTSAPDAGDSGFWDAVGIPEDLRQGIASSVAVDVWPEHVKVLEVFSAMLTQWRIGMAGPTGLDYSVLPAVLDLYEIPSALRRGLFDDLRIMEASALAVFADGRK